MFNSYLNENLQGRWIGRASDNDNVLLKWPPRSPDLTPCDFFSMGLCERTGLYPPLFLQAQRNLSRESLRCWRMLCKTCYSVFGRKDHGFGWGMIRGGSEQLFWRPGGKNGIEQEIQRDVDFITVFSKLHKFSICALPVTRHTASRWSSSCQIRCSMSCVTFSSASVILCLSSSRLVGRGGDIDQSFHIAP